MRLVLGLLQVVGTVKKHKGTHFSTGPTTSSRHSKKLEKIQKLKALILVLGLLQVVGTVKILNYRLCLHKFVEM